MSDEEKVPLVDEHGQIHLAEWIRAWPNGVAHDEIAQAAAYYEAHPLDRPAWLVMALESQQRMVLAPLWLERMRRAAGLDGDGFDEEAGHSDGDKILIEIARANGHNELADVWEAMGKWYA